MGDIKIIKAPITRKELGEVAEERFGDMVKAVVDIDKGIMAIGGELHADEEQVLLEQDSKQNNVWGINLYVNEPKESWLEFDSMINIRPSQGNRTRGVNDPAIQQKIRKIVDSLILP